MKFAFTADFDYSPPEFKGAVTVGYKAGQTLTIPHAHAEAAKATGAGDVVVDEAKPAPRRKPRL